MSSGTSSSATSSPPSPADAAAAIVGEGNASGHHSARHVLATVAGGGRRGLAVGKILLEQLVEEAGGNDADVLDVELGGLLEGLALGVVQRVGHEDRDAVGAG